MFFAPDPETQCRWWANHMIDGEPQHEGLYWWLETGEGTEIGFHPADSERNPLGGTPVVYWNPLHGVDRQLQDLLAVGCTLHRGPLAIGSGRRICQVLDPFGNCFGLDGR